MDPVVAQHLALADQHQPGSVGLEQRLGRVDDLLGGRLKALLAELEVLQWPDALEERLDVDALLDLHLCAAYGRHSCASAAAVSRAAYRWRRASPGDRRDLGRLPRIDGAGNKPVPGGVVADN
jgi:hypothetical protein